MYARGFVRCLYGVAVWQEQEARQQGHGHNGQCRVREYSKPVFHLTLNFPTDRAARTACPVRAGQAFERGYSYSF